MKGTLAIGTERSINPGRRGQVVNLRIGAFGMKRVFCLLFGRGDTMSRVPKRTFQNRGSGAMIRKITVDDHDSPVRDRSGTALTGQEIDKRVIGKRRFIMSIGLRPKRVSAVSLSPFKARGLIVADV
jgi:hypothetical protein